MQPLVLHTTLCQQMYLWAEVPPDPAKENEISNVSHTVNSYGLGPDELKKVVSQLIPHYPTHQNAILLCKQVPVGKDYDEKDRKIEPEPVPSFKSISNVSSTRATGTWDVASIPISWRIFFWFLDWVCLKGCLPSEIRLGPDFSYWFRVYTFAASLVARQQYRPGISIPLNGQRFARWEPHLTKADKRKFVELLRKIPASCATDYMETNLRISYVRKWEGVELTIKGFGFLMSAIRGAVEHLVREAGMRLSGSSPSVHDQPLLTPEDHWLRALLTGSPVVGGDQLQLEEFSGRWKGWGKVYSIREKVDTMLGVQMEAPKNSVSLSGSVSIPEGPWSVIPIQANKDYWHPGNRIEGPTLNFGHSETFQSLNGISPEEFVKGAYAAAARICPQIEGCYDPEKPSSLLMDPCEVLNFLTVNGPLLERLGYAVEYPEWVKKRIEIRPIALMAALSQPRRGLKGSLSSESDENVWLQWDVRLGRTRLSIDVLEKLANLQTPLLRVGKSWVSYDPDQVRTAWQMVNAAPKGIHAMENLLVCLKNYQPSDFDISLKGGAGVSQAVRNCILAFNCPLSKNQKREKKWLTFPPGPRVPDSYLKFWNLEKQLNKEIRVKCDFAVFWGDCAVPPSDIGSVEPVLLNAWLLKSFGPFPSWKGTQDLFKVMEGVYAKASQRATDLREGIRQYMASPNGISLNQSNVPSGQLAPTI